VVNRVEVTLFCVWMCFNINVIGRVHIYWALKDERALFFFLLPMPLTKRVLVVDIIR